MNEPEAMRLERLWSSDFGDAYTRRNVSAFEGREQFWQVILAKYPVQGALEVGCNIGANLRWICKYSLPQNVFGVDVNKGALVQLCRNLPGTGGVCCLARRLPFADSSFDLTFTAGVLIHQPDSSLPDILQEIVRCSRRYVLCIEYFAEFRTEVPYRGQRGALFKRNYGKIYQQCFPTLKLCEQGELTRTEGWDNVTFWLFRKQEPSRAE